MSLFEALILKNEYVKELNLFWFINHYIINIEKLE